MAEIVVVGAGVSGLCGAMLLARDGHRVTVLERDPAPPPSDAEEAWTGWERRGVNQFRMLHFFMPRFREVVEKELPEVARAMTDAGALRYNAVAQIPDEMKGGPRPGDEAFDAITGRRPVIEGAIAKVAEAEPGVTIRRGVAVAGLMTGLETEPGVPHVVGVRTDAGEELRADLVVDATGRRSPLPRWLEAIGARPCEEELDDSGFVYYGRHFRSADGSIPAMLGPLLSHYGSVSILTLPADNGTWGVGFTTCASDAAMRGLRDVERWERAIKEFPLVAHWAQGEPLSDDVAVMAKIEDRHRRYVVDGVPVATGVVAVADSWACTNPSVGRGATIGLLHVVALRDLLRVCSPSAAAEFARAFDDATMASVEPWYRATLELDRNRLAEAEAAARGEAYEPGDPAWEIGQALQHAAGQDGDVLRGMLGVASLLASVDEILARPGLLDKAIELGAGWREAPTFGPTRDELVGLVEG